jgi:HSP20 family protein
MVDPAHMLKRATAHLRSLEGLFGGDRGTGTDSQGSLFDPSIWRDLEEATAAMALRPPVPPGPQAPRQPKAPDFPAIDVLLTNEKVIVNAAIPGVEHPVDLHVSLVGETLLRIRGTVPPHPLNGQAATAQSEQRHGPFTRTVTLPAPVIPDSARCFYTNGLLEVWLDRRQERESTVPVTF